VVVDKQMEKIGTQLTSSYNVEAESPNLPNHKSGEHNVGT
jgi:hypothetical protein